MTRPKTYPTEQRKAARKAGGKTLQIKSRYFRLVIPNLIDYTHKLAQLNKLKGDTLNLLLHKQKDLQYYKIAIQTHPTTQVPHLDVLLIYSKSVLKSLVRFDYLIKHGHLTRYRKLNEAILAYSSKEDPQVLSNFPKSSDFTEDLALVLTISQLKKDSYRHLELQMLKDPLHFNLEQYVRMNDLAQYISSWSSVKTKLKDMQVAAANLTLRSKLGFKYIDRALIQRILSPSELQIYNSWGGYQTIVNYLNQIVFYGCTRPFKSKQLLLVGPPDTGKTSLIRQLQKHVATYHLDVSNWYPNYRDNVYKLFFWDQFKLKGGMSHTDLLKFLQGSPMDLQYKGGSSLRCDNQLIIMTSNMTLDQHIQIKFKDKRLIQLAQANLSTRIEQVILPNTLNLFLLQKLIKVKLYES